MTTTEYTAKWDSDQSMYCCLALEIWSTDGDEWHDDYGGHPDSDEFHAATIRLVGGPRDGEVVS